MIQAVRIEHSDGQGMFGEWFIHENGDETPREHSTVGKFLPEVLYRHNGFNTPYEDFGYKFEHGQHFCAYKSIDQLQQWIYPNEMKIIIDRGYCVYLLELEDVLVGRDQICYKKSDIISKQDITSLFK